MNAFRRMLDRRRRENVAQLAGHLAAHPDERHYGYDVAKVTGQRSAVMYRLMQRFLDNGWLEDGWEEKPGDRPPRRYYVITDLGRAELPRLAAGLEANR